MVPGFLRSLANLARRLIAESRAVHITEADVAELEMLAWLFEQHGPVMFRIPKTVDIADCGYGVPGYLDSQVAPADIAWAWLKLSRALPDFEASGGAPFEDGLHEVSGDRIKRAAVCAELAALSILALIPMTAQYGGELRVQTHLDGTPEGARAAWEFAAQNLGIGKTVDQAVRGGLIEMADKYRRELEAMK